MSEVNTQQIMDLVTVWGLKVIGAIAILLIGWIVARSVRKTVRRVMGVRDIDPSLIGFVSSLVYAAVMAFVVIAALAKFGIQTASFVAILGAVAFAVGLALQGTLANFASGVMILLFRPFRTGDFIDAAGVMGSVKDISIFSTTLATPDNVKIIVPNGKLYGDTIKNYSGNETRRVDMVMGIGYASDIDKAMEIIHDLLGKDDRVLAEPEPLVAVGELADSSVNINVRPWTKASDYWAFRFDFLKACKQSFDEAGIEIPFPQRTVHMQKAEG